MGHVDKGLDEESQTAGTVGLETMIGPSKMELL